MEAPGNGSVLAAKAVEPQGKVDVVAADAVETQDNGGVLPRQCRAPLRSGRTCVCVRGDSSMDMSIAALCSFMSPLSSHLSPLLSPSLFSSVSSYHGHPMRRFYHGRAKWGGLAFGWPGRQADASARSAPEFKVSLHRDTIHPGRNVDAGFRGEKICPP